MKTSIYLFIAILVLACPLPGKGQDTLNIQVTAADGTDVTVWTAAGAQAYAGDAAALAGQTFEAGVYIVKAGGTTHKVIVK